MNIIKSILFSFIIIEILIGISLYSFGFRIVYSPELETSWDAVAATGQWAGAIFSLLIPFAVIYIQHLLDINKREIGESNVELLREIKEFQTKYSEKIQQLSSLVNEDGIIVVDGGNFKDESSASYLKDKALKFINISMITKTQNVAEHLGLTEEETFDLLVEMVRHDGTISSGGQLRKENLRNIIWTKKSTR